MEKKQPAIGGLLNMLIPGLGYVYVGKWFGAVGGFLGGVALILMLGYVVNFTQRSLEPPPYIFPAVAIGFYLLILFLDGFQAVSRYNQSLDWVKCPACKKTNPVNNVNCMYCGFNFRELPPNVTLQHTQPPGRNRSPVLVIFGVVVIIAFLACAFLIFAIGTGLIEIPEWDELTGGGAPAGVTQVPRKVTPIVKPTSRQTSSPFPTYTATQLPTLSLFSGDAACGHGVLSGITCLDNDGWIKVSAMELTAIQDDLVVVKNIAMCPDGRLWLVQDYGISVTDGENWQVYTRELEYTTNDLLVCDPGGGLWLAGYKGVTYFDGDAVVSYPAEEIEVEDEFVYIKDLALAPDGRIWLIVDDHVAVLDGENWTIYGENQGFDQQYYLNTIAVGPDGVVWVGTSSRGMLAFDGQVWTNYNRNELTGVTSLAFDPDGRLWIGTDGDGVTVYDNGGWTNYNRDNSGLSSDNIASIAADQQGRIWIGTEWGLNVFSEGEWQVYHMHTADLAHNEMLNLTVSGAGPELPALVEKAPGSLIGRIVDSGAAIPDATVEICVESIYLIYTGATPCSDQPFMRTTTTDADGYFLFEDLPTGYYVMTFNKPEGGWIKLTGLSGILAAKLPVVPGEVKDIGEIEISD